ncbi:MAG: hypothetical protein DME05_15155 [Candidatus Rokuibacteriota bacterium]|nr:MAG: hypothetical protein DME05_15155 [Candidatus Rokubacteria bacterium]
MFTIIDNGRASQVDEPAGTELAKRAEGAGRPVAIDPAERVAYLGVTASDRAGALSSLEAPDFTLPDLDGRLHSLSHHRGRKVLLVAYASW